MSRENFFDFREKLSAKPPAAKGEALTVSQLTAQIERAIKAGVPGTVHVKGEVSNFNLHKASGHMYFTLKDAAACIDCVMFRSDAARVKFAPNDGMELLTSGRVAVYPQRGRYQLYVTSMSPLGQGALELAFRQLCEKLQKEGLFEPERKKPLPRYPTRIALVTSRSTAALQDILKVLRRYSFLQLMLFHVPVQGDGSAELIADAIRTLSAATGARGEGPGARAVSPLAARPLPLSIDLIILSRGGGSLEDLWEFNEEIVARAIAASRIPVVTGIGHEVDVSIADLVADYHAHTPTEAAQVVTSHWKSVQDLIDQGRLRLLRGLRLVAQNLRQRLLMVQRHEFFRRPGDRMNRFRQLLDERESKLQRLVLTSVSRRRERIELLERHLEAISPKSVLRRGYSITTRKKDGSVIRSANDVRVSERLTTQFIDGQVESTVEDQKQLPLFE